MSTEFKNIKIGYYVHSKALLGDKHSEMEMLFVQFEINICSCFVIYKYDVIYTENTLNANIVHYALKSGLLNEYLKLQNCALQFF